MDFKGLFKTGPIKAYFLIRIILGYVFLVAGLQKFIFPDAMGPGRFEEMGYANPEFIAYFVGTFEVLGAVLILIGLFSRFAAVPLIFIMIVAIATTKFPIITEDGFWPFFHAIRLDFSMLLAALFVLVNGSGKKSLDYILFDDKEDRSFEDED